MQMVYVILVFSLIFFSMSQAKNSDYFLSKSVQKTKVDLVNETIARNDSEVWALDNKRLYEDVTAAALSKDVQFLTWEDLKNFVQGWANREFLDFETWEVWWYAKNSKWIDFNVTNVTNRVVKSEWLEKLNVYTNNIYDIFINSNITSIWDTDNEQFRTLRIRWWNPWDNADIQINLHRFEVNEEVSFEASEMLNEFYNARFDWDYKKKLFSKKIIYANLEQDSKDVSDAAYSSNPQYELFDKTFLLNDIVSWEDFKPKDYLYYLNIESLDNTAIPIMIEAFNSDWDRVWFVWDYTITYDSFWLWRWNKKRVQLVQTVWAWRMKYFSKSLFWWSDISKSDAY